MSENSIYFDKSIEAISRDSVVGFVGLLNKLSRCTLDKSITPIGGDPMNPVSE